MDVEGLRKLLPEWRRADTVHAVQVRSARVDEADGSLVCQLDHTEMLEVRVPWRSPVAPDPYEALLIVRASGGVEVVVSSAGFRAGWVPLAADVARLSGPAPEPSDAELALMCVKRGWIAPPAQRPSVEAEGVPVPTEPRQQEPVVGAVQSEPPRSA